ncbi:matrixin family metalloprotease [Nocardioides sp. 616]|uniref:matrixin family metalloprotease n=1 Tax=Nocardioides sp. 616 TaxID=2268090 RepID=UPI000CE36F0C|nr:matrixin family metalloprotease [Nocardioides sp. 616]
MARIGPATLGIGIAVALLCGLSLLSPGSELQRLREMAGVAEPLGVPPEVDESGSYAFTVTQPGSSEPVGYSPCRAIHYRVNPLHAPEDYQDYVDQAVRQVSAATGLVFEYQGTTDSREFFGPAVDRDAPVVVAWATEDEVEALAGNVAGVAGSSWIATSPRHRQYSAGSVVLDADSFASFWNPEYDLEAIVTHEFGHLVGLAHVEDRHELMNAETTGQRTFGPGDLSGLARLGRVPCR